MGLSWDFNLSTAKTQNAKRVLRNACSERRRGLYLSLAPEAAQSFFGSLQNGSAVSHRVFHFFASLTSVNSTTIKFVRGQNLFVSEKKRIQEGNLTCPTNLVRPEPFLLQSKKDPELGRSTFWWLHPPVCAHKSSCNPFLFGGKGFSVQAHEIH